MRVTNLLAFLFAAGSIAMPVNKRQTDEVLVTEVEYVDQYGDVISVAYETAAPTPVGGAPAATPQPQGSSAPVSSAPASATPPSSSQAPAPVAAQSQPANSPSPVASPSATPTPVSQTSGGSGGASGGSAAQAVEAYISANGNADTLYVGWVDPSDPKFGEIAVYHHNIHRLNHSVSTVSYNDSMASQAQAWAEKCITEEEVPAGSGMGMNVAFSTSTDGYNPSYFVTGSWYNSEIDNFPAYGNGNLPVGDGTNFNDWGHFTQVVWPNVTQIGCGVFAGCNDGFAVHSGCFYYIEGNIEGEFNVINEPGGAPIAFPNGQDSM